MKKNWLQQKRIVHVILMGALVVETMNKEKKKMQRQENVSFPKQYCQLTNVLEDLIRIKEKQTYVPQSIIASVFESIVSLIAWIEDYSHKIEDSKAGKFPTSHIVRQLFKLKSQESNAEIISKIKSIEQQLHIWRTEVNYHQRKLSISTETKKKELSERKKFLRNHNVPSITINVIIQNKKEVYLQLEPFNLEQFNYYSKILWLKCYSFLRKEKAKIISLESFNRELIDFQSCQKHTRLAFLGIPKNPNLLPILWTAAQPQFGEISNDTQTDNSCELKLEISKEYIQLFQEPHNVLYRDRYLRYFSTKGSKTNISFSELKNFQHFLNELKEFVNKQVTNITLSKKRKREDPSLQISELPNDLDEFLLAFGLD